MLTILTPNFLKGPVFNTLNERELVLKVLKVHFLNKF